MAKMASLHAEQVQIPLPEIGQTIAWGRHRNSGTIIGATDLGNGKMSLTIRDKAGKVSSMVIDPKVFIRRR